MKQLFVLAGLLVAAPAFAAAPAPTEAQLSQALQPILGVAPRVAGVRCQPSTPGFVRCTYLHLTDRGYSRWAVLVSPHDGRWTVSEGPIREKPGVVRRRPPAAAARS
jgi:hypothetical protein